MSALRPEDRFAQPDVAELTIELATPGWSGSPAPARALIDESSQAVRADLVAEVVR